MMKILGVTALLRAALVGALLSVPLLAQAAASDHDTLDKGPKVGAAIPQLLAATDQNGRAQDFASLKGERGLILLFSRSLDWWPYCKIQAVAWNARISEFKSLGYEVAEVTYDPVDILKRFAAREKIGYTLLSDPRSAIIGAFGLIDGSVPRNSNWYGLAHPMIFVIGPKGVIRHRFSETNYQNRPDVEVILDILRKEATG